MPRDSLFAQLPPSQQQESATPFASEEEIAVARAFADVLLGEGDKYHITNLSSLSERFESADVGNQFEAWSTGQGQPFITVDKLKEALGEEILTRISERANLPETATLDRLATVLPRIVVAIAPFDLATSSRAFRFNLGELRKKLR